MSSYKSHTPPELEWKRLCGLGMNDEELRANDQLTEYLVHNLNTKPTMPFGDEEFDGAVVTVSVQYMTKPLETFRDVCRVLKPGAPFIVTYSNRMFPTKAVRIWRALDDRERAGLISRTAARRRLRRAKRRGPQHRRRRTQRSAVRRVGEKARRGQPFSGPVVGSSLHLGSTTARARVRPR